MLIVIVIIGILAAALIPRLTGMRQRAYDVAVKADLRTLSNAMELYYMDHGTYKIENAGYAHTGTGGNGGGRVVQEGDFRYPRSIARALTEGGYIQGGIKASGKETNSGFNDYMLYLCNNNLSYSISAKLYHPTDSDIAHIQTTCNGTGANGTHTRYGMNYAVAGG